MAVPYGRKSRSKSRMQRAANMKYTAKPFSKCSHCAEPKMPHRACGACGYYNNRPVRPVVEA
jgi:large subunit ribosomal protein L32